MLVALVMFFLLITMKRKTRVVELRFFGGLTVEETASVLNVSPDIATRLAAGQGVAAGRDTR